MLKRHIVVLSFLIFLCKNINCQEMICLLDNKLTFSIPEGVINRNTGPFPTDFLDIQEYMQFWKGKTEIRTSILTEDVLRNEYQGNLITAEFKSLLKTKKTLTNRDIINLFKQNNKYIIFKYRENEKIYCSYRFLKLYSSTIGESYFNTDWHNMEAPAGFRFTFSIIIDDKIVNIFLSLLLSGDIFAYMPEYFLYNRGKYYWKDQYTIEILYNDIISNQHFPNELQLFCNAYESISKTLKINEIQIKQDKQ
jgi:hypothetical protein